MSFLAHFGDIDDPRNPINVKHDLLDVLFLAVSAVISGAEGWKDIKEFGDEKLDWLRQYRTFNNGIPVDDTIARIIRAIEPEQFNRAFINWVNEVRSEKGQEQIAIDGKTLRHSFDGERHTALHSITAWSKSQGLVLAQLKSTGKKNENASVLDMLDHLNIKGALISADAMNTQRKIADKIIKKQGDYILCVKNNHKTLRAEIAAYFHKVKRDTPEHINYSEETNGGHGRIEVRRYRQLHINEWIKEAQHWAGISSIVEVERERHIKGKVQHETLYYISSLAPDVARIADAIRSHWEVENKVHWVLDVTFKEDDSRIRKGDGAENVAVIRRFALNLARLHPQKNSMRGKLKQAGWSDKIRSEIVFGLEG
ncbi:MAG: ISAs1 family transposase [Gammaproteobacteria bacterium]|nr:ISAs1 family transposase [Gammaproteobacteria bacterium]